MLDSLHGKVAVVTGGAMGIGYGIVKRFAEYGGNVLLVDREGEHAESAAGRISGSPGKVVVLKQDVNEEGAGDKIVAKCIQEFGSIDILVNNAGDLSLPIAPLADMVPEMFDEFYKSFLKAMVFVSRAAAQKMVEGNTHGKIINIASISAFSPSKLPGLIGYDAAKGGVVMFTKNLALELAAKGITVNAIAPGSAQTEGAAKAWDNIKLSEQEKQKISEDIMNKIPLGRLAMPDDIAKVALFLASPLSDYMTGETVVVDGGTMLT